MTNAQYYEYFGLEVKVWKIEDNVHPYPWRFAIYDYRDGYSKYEYHGIPNQCETKRSALKRAWYRAKWIVEGTHNKKYTSSSKK